MALTALRERFSGKAAAAGIAAALVMTPLGGATAQDAQLQQQAEFTQTATTNVADIQVPMRDARGAELPALRLSVAGMSANMNQVLVYYGDDAQVFESIRQGARSVIAEGILPLRGIVIASPKQDVRSGNYYISSPHQLEVWSDGQIISTIDNPDRQTGQEISQILANDMEKVRALATRQPSPDRG